jgi:sec-independent protein translocase protein TatA
MNVLLFAFESPTIIILVVAAIFLLFGGTKLPQLARALGQSKKAFKEGMDDSEREEKKKSDSRASLESVDDEALFEEARRRAQEIRAGEGKKIEDEKLLSGKSER